MRDTTRTRTGARGARLCAASTALGLLGALALSPGVHAADRPTRGGFVGTGAGFVTGSATDEDGRSAGAFLGGGGILRFGEEAIPGLTLGLEFLGGGGPGANERYSTGFGGFVLQATWRPFDDPAGLVLLLGTGVGGGELVPEGTDGFEGLAGGSFHELGAIYEFELWSEGTSSLVLAPGVRWWLVPTTADNAVWLQSFAIGLETTWYFGDG